jgi:FkbH-like protein
MTLSLPERASAPPAPSPDEDRPAATTPAPLAGTIAIAATFTAEGIAEPLSFMLETADVGARVEFAQYNQVFQELISPASLLGLNNTGTNIVLVRVQDFIRDTSERTNLASIVEGIAGEFLAAARQYAQRARVATIFFIGEPPAVPEDPALASTLRRLEGEIGDALAQLPDVTVIRHAQVDALCDTPRLDPIADKIAHAPYTDDYLGALSIALARTIHLQRVPAHKVLVLDCDNTIWRGVVGEDGVEGIALDPAFVAVQEFAVAAQARGTLVCLASKNAEADVLEVFDKRSDMRLARDHVVAHRINWEPKPANLRALARELNLGLDSFVFVDDNPVECGAMMEALPEVVTLQLPPPDAVASFLDHLWVFDKAVVTQEDQQRTQMYRQNAARESLEASTADIGEFLASLALKITIAAPAEDEWARMAQMTQRTNQFNFTTRRRTEAEMRALAATHDVFGVHVSDRFGQYGLVGALIAKRRPDVLEVDTFLLSCRVLGRGVEHGMAAHLGQLAQSAALATVRLPLVKTAKNEPALAFADSILASWRADDEAGVVYTIPSATLAAIRHRAGEDAEAVIAARRADAAKPGKAPATAVTGRSSRHARLAGELTTGAAVTAAWRAAVPTERRIVATQASARTATERALVALWEEILGVRGIGIDDDFFALGGSSLQAARMIAEIGHSRAVTLPLTTIIEAPTIRAFSSRVDEGDVAGDGGLVPLRQGGPRKLFLVHDGDGETLLYRNIARRLPAELDVYGIQPRRKSRIPLAHLSIEEMAAAYVSTVREAQPQGPYLLGGMCAGGLIAFEMARQLERDGQAVERVLMLDSATPNLAHKSASQDARRSSRLKSAMAAAREGRGRVAGALRALGVLARKVAGAAAWEASRLRTGLADRHRLRVLRRVLAADGAWPAGLPSLDFRAIYNDAERRYVPGASTLRALLVRARAGSGNDTPYVDVYEDPTLGWGRVIAHLDVVDVDGGHSSMLQEPHAASLANVLRAHLAPGATPA